MNVCNPVAAKPSPLVFLENQSGRTDGLPKAKGARTAWSARICELGFRPKVHPFSQRADSAVRAPGFGQHAHTSAATGF